ncbi:hypothetical protein AHAS_Ahas10G0148100 [Arachis hypogaea]
MAETRFSIRNLEIQVGQLSKKIPEIPSNTLPSNTEVNTKEECKALTVGAEAEPKEEPAPEELKEIKAQEETGSVTMHVPKRMEEPKDQLSLDVQEESKEEQLARILAILRNCKPISLLQRHWKRNSFI